jgi:hypothetical protein
MANPLTLTITERDEDGCKRPFLVTDDPEVIRAVAAALGRRLGADSPERRRVLEIARRPKPRPVEEPRPP